jgi:prevent-host-death family protein
VGAFEAKTHLAQLLERANRGETITVTKRGKPFARLAPADQASPDRVAQAMADLRALRQSVKPEGLSILELRDEGRR